MAILITGLQGSGKSYKAMYDMYTQQNKYYKIFTNLDGLKKTPKILPLNFKKFTDDILAECYNIIVTQSKEYEDVIEYLQRIYMLPDDVSKENRIMLVIDEAQNYFNKKNPVLAWFITQHRHLYMELVLITQKYTLLHSDYHLFNIAYNAFPPVKQFSKNSIAYNEYAGLPMNTDNFVRKFSLKKEKKIFDMYVSGDKVESPNILKRFIWMLFIAIGVIVAVIYYFANIYGHPNSSITKPKASVPSNTKQISSSVKHIDNTVIEEDGKFYTFVLFENSFSILDYYTDNTMPLTLFNYIKKHYFIKVIDVVKHDRYHTSVYVIANSSLEKLLNISKDKPSQLSQGVQNAISFH